jgi:hypothetical protein
MRWCSCQLRRGQPAPGPGPGGRHRARQLSGILAASGRLLDWGLVGSKSGGQRFSIVHLRGPVLHLRCPVMHSTPVPAVRRSGSDRRNEKLRTAVEMNRMSPRKSSRRNPDGPAPGPRLDELAGLHGPSG